MGLPELFIIAVGLSMDAFAVAICKGLSVKEAKISHSVIVGAYFGGFQALMPLIGWLLGTLFAEVSFVRNFAHWIAFILLALIGINMIRESLSKEEEECLDASFGVKAMIPLAVATSIDAMASGVSFACLDVQILPAVALIGVTTFAFSAAGLKIGRIFGARFKFHAELFGGAVLVLMGLKILLEHYGVL